MLRSHGTCESRPLPARGRAATYEFDVAVSYFNIELCMLKKNAIQTIGVTSCVLPSLLSVFSKCYIVIISVCD